MEKVVEPQANKEPAKSFGQTNGRTVTDYQGEQCPIWKEGMGRQLLSGLHRKLLHTALSPRTNSNNAKNADASWQKSVMAAATVTMEEEQQKLDQQQLLLEQFI